jgi:hypothetical protein
VNPLTALLDGQINRNVLARVTIAISLVLFARVLPADAAGQKKPKEARDSVTVQADALALSGVPASVITLEDKITWSTLYSDWHLNSLKSVPPCVTATADKDQAYVFHIVHWAAGDAGKPPRLVSSSWSAYGSKRFHPDTLRRKLAPNGDPLIYGKRKVLVIGVNVFDDMKNGATTLSIRYKSSVTQGTPENTQALSQLASALLGLASAAKAAQGAILIAFDCQQGTAHLPFDLNVVETIGLPGSEDDSNSKQEDPLSPPTSVSPATYPSSASSVRMSAAREDHPVESPTYLNVSLRSSANSVGKAAGEESSTNEANRNGSSPQNNTSSPPPKGAGGSPQDTGTKPASPTAPKSGQADCSSLTAKNNCTVSRTLTSLDKEWWDISLAVPIPGVRESKYSISSGALLSKPTTHTDLYALFDIYPWAKWVTKDSAAPHLSLGLPVTGQTFYRPAFGLSENLTGWNFLGRSFPVPMSFFAGVAYMKTTSVQGTPTTAAQLAVDSTTKRVLKPIFGIEVPVSALISKVGKGNKSNASNGATGKGGTSANQGSTVTQ